MLHKINLATLGGFELHKLLDNTFRPKPRRFKPTPLSKLLKPHPVWYIRRNQKRIFELGMYAAFGLTLITLLIKNWG